MSVVMVCPKCGAGINGADFSGRCNRCGLKLAAPQLRKLCCMCESDLTMVRKVKDQFGNYYCEACFAERSAETRAGAQDEPAPRLYACVNCHEVYYDESEVTSVDGKCVCKGCFAQGEWEDRAFTPQPKRRRIPPLVWIAGICTMAAMVIFFMVVARR